MTEDMIFTLSQSALQTMLLLASPLLLSAMVIGILVSVFQAATQINEATLTFIPKMIAVIVVFMLMGPWMLQILMQYTTDVIEHAADWIEK